MFSIQSQLNHNVTVKTVLFNAKRAKQRRNTTRLVCSDAVNTYSCITLVDMFTGASAYDVAYTRACKSNPSIYGVDNSTYAVVINNGNVYANV